MILSVKKASWARLVGRRVLPTPPTRAEVDRLVEALYARAASDRLAATRWLTSEAAREARDRFDMREMQRRLAEVSTFLDRTAFELAYPPAATVSETKTFVGWAAGALDIAMPTVHFFEPVLARPGLVGFAFRPGNEVYLRADLEGRTLAWVCFHESRHLAQPKGMATEAAEADAEDFAARQLVAWTKRHEGPPHSPIIHPHGSGLKSGGRQ